MTQQTHRLFLLRVKLMHFVNSLHNYIMTRVRVSLSLPWRLWQSHRCRGAHTTLTDCSCEIWSGGSVAGRYFEHARAHRPRGHSPPDPNPRSGTATLLLRRCLQNLAHGPFSLVSGDSCPLQQPRSVSLVWHVKRKMCPNYILLP